MPFEIVYDWGVEEVIDRLSLRELIQVSIAIAELKADPHPDGRSKHTIGFRYPPGPLGYSTDDLFIAYRVDEGTTVRVRAIVRRDS